MSAGQSYTASNINNGSNSNWTKLMTAVLTMMPYVIGLKPDEVHWTVVAAPLDCLALPATIHFLSSPIFSFVVSSQQHRH